MIDRDGLGPRYPEMDPGPMNPNMPPNVYFQISRVFIPTYFLFIYTPHISISSLFFYIFTYYLSEAPWAISHQKDTHFSFSMHLPGSFVSSMSIFMCSIFIFFFWYPLVDDMHYQFCSICTYVGNEYIFLIRFLTLLKGTVAWDRFIAFSIMNRLVI